MSPAPRSRRRFFAPEVIQSSAMDCGPASLKCLLDGYGAEVSYGRLREACQTDVDGTSIDTLEDLAVQLGLAAEQVIVPADHVPLKSAKLLPAIVVVVLPNRATHFVVVWRAVGSLVQVMDPGRGRYWTTWKALLPQLYQHQMAVPAEGWREWAGSVDFLDPLRERLALLGVRKPLQEEWIARGLDQPEPFPLAALDACARMTDELIRAGGIGRGAEAERLIGRQLERCLAAPRQAEEVIPAPYWSARAGAPAPGGTDLVTRGAVLVRVLGRERALGEAPEAQADAPRVLSADLEAALREPPQRPWRTLWRLLRQGGAWSIGLTVGALIFSALIVVFEAVLFRGLLGIGRLLGTADQRLLGVGVLVALVALTLALEFFSAASLLKLGRRLENRLRIAFFEKLPHIADRYFHSRLTSDMAQRAHSVYGLRSLPAVVGRFLQNLFVLGFTAAGIAWLDPGLTPLAIAAAGIALVVPVLSFKSMAERDLRFRTHGGSLTQFYLDALLGLVALRTHGAQPSVRTEHESLLSEWYRSGIRLLRASVVVEMALAISGYGMAAWLLFSHLAHAEGTGNVLLLVYWALAIPVMGFKVAQTIGSIPYKRSVTLRLLEPLGSPEDTDLIAPAGAASSDSLSGVSAVAATPGPAKAKGISISMRGVVVKRGGHEVLRDVNLEIPAGGQLGILGPSGAGKSTLVGVLLGWYKAAAGTVLVDGAPLEGRAIRRLRKQTAWVDPAVQLWNRSLLYNIRYGAPSDAPVPIGDAVEAADLRPLVEILPDGLQTQLGESGALVSGGEGQRVRLARGMVKDAARLVVLDEPFRGLDRGRRKELMTRARWWWQAATLICISHDIRSLIDFDQIIVIEQGRISEAGAPKQLLSRPDSRLKFLLEAEREVTEDLWRQLGWRRLWLEGHALGTRKSEGEAP